MIDYSQNGEGKVILDFFRGKVGTFLDAGANDGVTLSNSRALALIGWSGVCVEPAPEPFAKLQALYNEAPGIHCVNAAITEKDGPVDFYDMGTHLNKGDTSLLATTRPQEMERWRGQSFDKTTVQGITVATLLARSPHKKFDFISIDCEGVDYMIMSQLPLAQLGCRMVCVEYNAKDLEKYTRYAARHGMRLHWRCFENAVYVRA